MLSRNFHLNYSATKNTKCSEEKGYSFQIVSETKPEKGNLKYKDQDMT